MSWSLSSWSYPVTFVCCHLAALLRWISNSLSLQISANPHCHDDASRQGPAHVAVLLLSCDCAVIMFTALLLVTLMHHHQILLACWSKNYCSSSEWFFGSAASLLCHPASLQRVSRSSKVWPGLKYFDAWPEWDPHSCLGLQLSPWYSGFVVRYRVVRLT